MELTVVVRTPQASFGGVGEGAAGVSTNSKSPSEISDADLTIARSDVRSLSDQDGAQFSFQSQLIFCWAWQAS